MFCSIVGPEFIVTRRDSLGMASKEYTEMIVKNGKDGLPLSERDSTNFGRNLQLEKVKSVLSSSELSTY